MDRTHPDDRSAPTSSRRSPGPEECLRILDRHGVPGHIVLHSEAVARIARQLAVDLACGEGAGPDVPLVVAAALLHDIAKTDCLGTGKDHAAEGGRLLREMGLSEAASIVERHVHPGPWAEEGPVTEAEIVAYSDKRVLHDRVVGLAERFEDLLQRYGGGHEERAHRLRRLSLEMASMERKIFRLLPYPPDAIPAGGELFCSPDGGGSATIPAAGK